MEFSASFLIARSLDSAAIEKLAALMADVHARSGRLMIIGVGGSAANASHAVNDFRKLAGIGLLANRQCFGIDRSRQ
jgi:D-sedoheptulose 7-phosphate isomerase